ncbi:repressor LexA [candidate division WWE3 bacterium CG08_land_8_20_14_0_20_40_13]|uniref:LexA repressor n=1 Tax=candidate division WWE3 bacterium CG08_land_8_20_14_0_20_40_13 TaxID=1975084 RepID=A0A2H0XD76_UNCKA|nr:MAG: repressor LexA [candidate division WWE3 bacterium CG08_land_8_20_14_0_20_40_13]
MPVTIYNRQRQILDFIKQYIQKNGFSPTLAEIGKAMGLSSLATVHEHLQALEKKGVIKKFQGAVRGIDLLEQKIVAALDGIEIPLVGMIAAGLPIEAIEDPSSTVTVAPSLISEKKRNFALLVKGLSMKDMGILDGDYVICEQQNYADEGDVVVALLENDLATLKRYYREGKMIKLVPANSEMLPILVDEDKIKIQGVVKGVIRRY